ncbi:MAG: SRPBCC family protein [Rhodoferax sp.]|nr:SRPBCC family protein [Rhodoferax sp.]
MTVPLALPSVRAADVQVWVQDNDVRIQRVGDRFLVELEFVAPVPLALAWAVLTDFARMRDFVPNLTSSEVLERNENLLRVMQKGVARYGPFSAKFESTREILLFAPTEIRSHNVGGTVKQMDSVMQLQSEGSGTRLRYRAEVSPGIWFPPLVGPALVRHEVAEQFSAIVQEMVRRR